MLRRRDRDSVPGGAGEEADPAAAEHREAAEENGVTQPAARYEWLRGGRGLERLRVHSGPVVTVATCG